MDLNTYQNFEHVCSSSETYAWNIGDEAIEDRDLLNRKNFEFHMQPPSSVDLTTMKRMFDDLQDLVPATSSSLTTIFSPLLSSVDFSSELVVDGRLADEFNTDFPQLGCDYNSLNSPDQSFNISDFFISDMTVASDFPYDANIIYNEITTDNDPFVPFARVENDVLFNGDEQSMMLPFCEDMMVDNDAMPSEDKSGDSNFYLAFDQSNADVHICEVNPPEFVQIEGMEFLVNNMPNLSEWFCETPMEVQRERITLVLDLDETLIHSSFTNPKGADFKFRVFFDMKEHNVFVKMRPFVKKFLHRVAEMFTVAVFTASHSVYAKKVIEKLDPSGNLISRRAYRDSCVFPKKCCLKNLSVFGIDLSKIAIIDNSPEVYRLHVDNGIPIKSWDGNPSDDSLMSLLPFLETLADADDVRPLISQKFGNKS